MHCVVNHIDFYLYLSIYNEYSAKLQKAISGRGKNIMMPYKDKKKKKKKKKIQLRLLNKYKYIKNITHFEYIV